RIIPHRVEHVKKFVRLFRAHVRGRVAPASRGFLSASRRKVGLAKAAQVLLGDNTCSTLLQPRSLFWISPLNNSSADHPRFCAKLASSNNWRATALLLPEFPAMTSF